MSSEYFMIEDGILADLRLWEIENGPNRAIQEFLLGRNREYRTDREYCDFYGHKAIWNTNGYLAKN